jgi:hypothetical protein
MFEHCLPNPISGSGSCEVCRLVVYELLSNTAIKLGSSREKCGTVGRRPCARKFNFKLLGRCDR